MLMDMTRATCAVLVALIVSAPPAVAQRSGAVLTGSVLDASSRPVEGAEVFLSGVNRGAVTDERGAFRIAGIPAGTYEVRVRRVGWTPLEVAIAFADGDSVHRQLTLVSITVLDTSVTTAVEPWRREFEEHRRIGLGRFVTQEDIERQKPAEVAQLLSRLPGVKLARSPKGAKWHVFSRTGVTSLSGRQCGAGRFADVYVNGVRVYEYAPNRPPDPLDAFDINTFHPSRIAAIEYYARASQTPVQYQNLNSTCGVLVIWLKR